MKTVTANWFTVDKEGLAKLLARKGKEFVVYELLQNSWDTGAAKVTATLRPVEGRPLAELRVEDDDPDGFKDLTHAWTLFAESEKKGNPEKRGRFNLGEKLVLALCTEAVITTTTGCVIFSPQDGRRRARVKREKGSEFFATIRMTRNEIDDAIKAVHRLIVPPGVETIFNGEPLPRRTPLATFEATLQTEIADEQGVLRRSARKATVEVYEPHADETPSIYEMGIPVVETGDKWHYNVLQKVPLNSDRDNVTPSYLQNVRMLVLNEMHKQIEKDDATQSWVRDASADPDAAPAAVETVITHRFGEKRVIMDPTDPEGTKRAVSEGYTVVSGGALSGGEWANVKRDNIMRPAGQVTPSSKLLATSPDGVDDSVPFEKWTPGMHKIVKYAQELSMRLPIPMASVSIVNRFREKHAAWYGHMSLTFNLARLGHAWFEKGPNPEVDKLLIHEFGHHFSNDHLSKEYYAGLCELGAAMTELALEDPDFFKRYGREGGCA